MRATIVAAMIFALAPAGPAVAGEWSLRLGDMRLEGISVDESVAGDTYYLGLTSEFAWFTFSFPADDGRRPESARALKVNLNGFEPDIRCTGIGADGLRLAGNRLSGSVVCSLPGGELALEAQFGN
ncbi:MAG: hypothetical protein DWQ08_04990 [Proteobacteria bacterium]|nr:MAG: hypothetical protein DWQ08_04990 [Pseudomonadota bacterium]